MINVSPIKILGVEAMCWINDFFWKCSRENNEVKKKKKKENVKLRSTSTIDGEFVWAIRADCVERSSECDRPTSLLDIVQARPDANAKKRALFEIESSPKTNRNSGEDEFVRDNFSSSSATARRRDRWRDRDDKCSRRVTTFVCLVACWLFGTTEKLNESSEKFSSRSSFFTWERKSLPKSSDGSNIFCLSRMRARTNSFLLAENVDQFQRRTNQEKVRAVRKFPSRFCF